MAVKSHEKLASKLFSLLLVVTMTSDDSGYSSKPHFPLLNDSNYIEWAMRMEAELVRKKLWFNVIEIDGEAPEGEEDATKWKAGKLAKRSKEKMQEARAEMILRVEGAVLRQE